MLFLDYLSATECFQLIVSKYLLYGIESFYASAFFLSLTRKHREHSENARLNTGCESPDVQHTGVCCCLPAVYWSTDPDSKVAFAITSRYGKDGVV